MIDLQADARRFVEMHYGARAGPVTVLGAGEWSRAYAFTLDGQEAVIRFGRHGEDFAKDRIMALVNSPRLPIPKVIESGAAADGYFAVSERAHGLLLDDLDEGGLRAVLPQLLTALDAIRDIDVSATRGYGLWGPDGAGQHGSWREALLDKANDRRGSRTHGWRAALEASPTGAAPFDQAFATLEELAPLMPEDRHVVHSDLLYHNVLVEDRQMTAVLDWGNALYGDHLYDAAWLLYWWRWYPAWSKIDILAEITRHWATSGGQPPDFDARLWCYQIHIGLDAQTYNAFTGRWDQLQENAERTLALVRRGLPPR